VKGEVAVSGRHTRRQCNAGSAPTFALLQGSQGERAAGGSGLPPPMGSRKNYIWNLKNILGYYSVLDFMCQGSACLSQSVSLTSLGQTAE